MQTADWTINTLVDIINARRQGREMALAAGFSLAEATKIAVVISELGRNIVEHARTGTVTLVVHTEGARGIKVVAQDQGPGIADVEQVLRGEPGSEQSGLAGVKRLVDQFDIQSGPGRGTRVTAVKWLR